MKRIKAPNFVRGPVRITGAFEFLCVFSQENKMATTIMFYMFCGHKDLEDYALIYQVPFEIYISAEKDGQLQ